VNRRRSGGGPGGRPPLGTAHHSDIESNAAEREPQRWRVIIVSERCSLWNRYQSELEAERDATKLRRVGMNARAEADV
jgi:hypothetical protein